MHGSTVSRSAAQSPSRTVRVVKYVVLVPDGCADEPVDELGGKTPLEAAALPNLHALAQRSEVGRATVIPGGLPPGSDVGNLAILGYDPLEFHTGRAPIEAAAMGIDLGPDEVAYRCNLVTLGADGTMVDFAAGHLSSEQSHPIVAALDAALGNGRDGVRFHAGVEYRHPRGHTQATGPTPSARRRTTSPASPRPSRPVPAAAKLNALMDASRPVVADAAARGRLDRDADLALGPGGAADAAAVRGRASASTVGSRPRSTSCAVSVSSPTSRCSTSPARARASRTTTARSATRASSRCRTATSSCCTSRRPTRRATSRTRARRCAALEPWDREIIGPLLEALPELRRAPHPADAGSRDPDPAGHPHLGPGAVPAVRLRGRGGGAAVHGDRDRGARRRRRARAHGPPDRLSSQGLKRPRASAPMERRREGRVASSSQHPVAPVAHRSRPHPGARLRWHRRRGWCCLAVAQRPRSTRAAAAGRARPRHRRGRPRRDGDLVLRRDPGRDREPSPPGSSPAGTCRSTTTRARRPARRSRTALGCVAILLGVTGAIFLPRVMDRADRFLGTIQQDVNTDVGTGQQRAEPRRGPARPDAHPRPRDLRASRTTTTSPTSRTAPRRR